MGSLCRYRLHMEVVRDLCLLDRLRLAGSLSPFLGLLFVTLDDAKALLVRRDA